LLITGCSRTSKDRFFGLSAGVRFLWSENGYRWTSEEDAQRTLDRIRDRISRGIPPAEAIGQFRSQGGRFEVEVVAEQWLDALEVEGRANYTLQGYRSYVRNYFGW